MTDASPSSTASTSGTGRPSGKPVVRLTALQRAALLHGPVLDRPLRKTIEAVGPGTGWILLSIAELGDLRRQLEEILRYSTEPRTRRLRAILRHVETALRVDRMHGRENSARADSLLPPQPRIDPKLIFEFKVTLLGIDPPIWRRIQVEDGSLHVLYCVLMLAMGWTDDFEPHRFEFGGKRYGPKNHKGTFATDPIQEEADITLGMLFPRGATPSTGIFEYDPTAGWRHELAFERHVPWDFDAEYPRVVEGARACPPEPIGGVEGYRRLLASRLADPGPRGRRFDPDAFDIAAVTKALRHVDAKAAGLRGW